jgi:isopentenyl-diphosphate delta-isomerase type 1
MSEECFDVVDENNRVIGQERRHVVHTSGFWHRGVHVFLFTSDRRLLIQRRSHAQDTYPHALDCSVSEHLRVSESYRDGAMRGLREELGLEQIPLRRLVQFRMNYGPNDNMINELYEGVCDDEPFNINQHEIEQIAYYTIPEIEAMMALGQAPFTSWFVQLLRWYTGKPVNMQVLWAHQ